MNPSPPVRRLSWRWAGCGSVLAVLIVLPYVGLWRLMERVAGEAPKPSALPAFPAPPSPPPPQRHPPVDSHPEGYEWVHGHQHGAKWVEGYWRRLPDFVPPTPPPGAQ